ncbi:MobA/MobL family protein [Providencia rettgeri]
MATYHFSVKFGAKGRGGAHADYITREGQYQHRGDLVHVEHGNMPAWAKEEPQHFWQAADQFERKNGSAYREFEIALPRELNSEQQIGLVREFVSRELGERHAYTLAIHNPTASIDGGEQPHAHVMMSLRVNDGIDRAPDQYFKRFNAKYPERGGAQKDSGHSLTLSEQREALVDLRERWADTHNRYVENLGIEQARIDHRSLADQGIARLPEYHLGFEASGRLTDEDKLSLKQLREQPDIERYGQEQMQYIDFHDEKWLSEYKQAMEHYRERFEQSFIADLKQDIAEQKQVIERSVIKEKTIERERGFGYGDY